MPDDGSPSSPFGYALLLSMLLIAAAFLAVAETALASVSKIRVISLADNNDRRADRVLRLLNHFDKTLTTLLICTNIIQIGIASIVTLMVTTFWGNDVIVYSTIVTTIVIFLFGETIPKCYAKVCNERSALAISGTVMMLVKLLTPITFVFTKISQFISMPIRRKTPEPTVSEDELYDIIETIVEEGAIDEEKGELVQSALEFAETRARDALTPWYGVQTLTSDMSADEIISIIEECRHSRLPVVDASGEVCGILSIREYLKASLLGGAKLSDAMTEVHFVSGNALVYDLLPDMSKNKTHMSVVLDDDGSVLGILTVEDILEELVGEIYDEDDVGGAEPIGEMQDEDDKQDGLLARISDENGTGGET